MVKGTIVHFGLLYLYYLITQKFEAMPQGNHTGPKGQGPGTVRQWGYCSDSGSHSETDQ